MRAGSVRASRIWWTSYPRGKLRGWLFLERTAVEADEDLAAWLALASVRYHCGLAPRPDRWA